MSIFHEENLAKNDITQKNWKVMYTLLYLKWITSEDLLCSTWNSAQFYVPAWMEGDLGENGYMYMYDLSSFAAHLKLPQHC